MSVVPPENELIAEVEAPVRTQWQLIRRRFFHHRVAVISTLVLILLILLCFGAKTIAFYPKAQQDLLLGPTGPSKAHWFGTDNLGIDQLTTLLYAGQVSLKIGLAVAFFSTLIGTIVGSIAGYFGKWSEQFLMRATDLFLVVPQIAVLAIALKKFGHSVGMIIFVLAALGWMYVARIVRGQVLSIKEKEYVEAARASGAGSARIIVRHILPNCIGPILVNATLAIAGATVRAGAVRSFLRSSSIAARSAASAGLRVKRAGVEKPAALLARVAAIALNTAGVGTGTFGLTRTTWVSGRSGASSSTSPMPPK